MAADTRFPSPDKLGFGSSPGKAVSAMSRNVFPRAFWVTRAVLLGAFLFVIAVVVGLVLLVVSCSTSSPLLGTFPSCSSPSSRTTRRPAARPPFAWMLLLGLALGSAALGAESPVRFPLQVHPSGRYLVDAELRPFRIHGDAAWDLAVQLPPAAIDRYLEHRQNQGFNTLTLLLEEHKRWSSSSHAPATPDGLVPFLRPGDLSTPNDGYFERIAWVVAEAGRHGMLVLAAPLWLGYVGRDDGWWVELNWPLNTREVCRDFGRYLARGNGGRFRGLKDAPNLVWVEGGDFFPPPGSEGTVRARAVMEGLREGGAQQLQTGHWSEEHVATDQPDFAARMELEAVYTYGANHNGNILPVARRGYAFDPGRPPHALPAFLIETQYESSGWLPPSGVGRSLKLAWRRLTSALGKPAPVVTRPAEVRRLLYWAQLSTIGGVVFGNEQLWMFEPDWPELLDTPGARDMGHLRGLLDSLRWWELVPSGPGAPTAAPLVAGPDDTAGGGDVAAAATPDRTLLVAYVPGRGSGQRTVGVRNPKDAERLRARWFDPTRGTWRAATLSPASGEFRSVTTPGPNGDGDGDWVLTIDPAG